MRVNLTSILLTLFLLRIASIGIEDKVISYLLLVIFLSGIIVSTVLMKYQFSVFVRLYQAQLFILIVLLSILSVTISIPHTAQIMNSIMTLTKLFIMLAVAFLGFVCGQHKLSNLYLKVVIVSLTIHVLIGPVLIPFGIFEEVHGTIRAVGLSGGVQIYSNLAMILFVFSTVLLFKKNNLFNKHIITLLWLVGAIGLYYSATLKNFAAALFVLSIPILFSRKYIFTAFPLVILSIILLLNQFSGPLMQTSVGQRIKVVWEAGIRTNLRPGEKLESSLVWRLIHWSKLTNDWLESHLVLGSGFGQVVYMDGLKTPDGRGYEAHSDVVTVVVEYGLFFAPIFVLLFSGIVVSLRQSTGYLNKAEYTGVYYLVLALVVAASFGNVLYSLGFMYFGVFFIFWVGGNTWMNKQRLI